MARRDPRSLPRLHTLTLGAIVAAATLGATVAAATLGACELRVDTDDGEVRLRWDAPSTVDEVAVIGDAVVEIRVTPWRSRAVVLPRGEDALGGLALDASGGRLSLVGETGPGAVAVVETPRLDRVRLVGDGRVTIYDVAGDPLALTLVGAGVLWAEGWTHELRLDARGGGSVGASGLWADTGGVALGASTHAEVCVRGGLDATVDEGASLVRRCTE